MRISDWSSDVCSSDLVGAIALVMVEDDRVALALRHTDRDEFVVEQSLVPCGGGALVAAHRIGVGGLAGDAIILREIFGGLDHPRNDAEAFDRLRHQPPARPPRSEERREGKEWFSTCRSRWSPCP